MDQRIPSQVRWPTAAISRARIQELHTWTKEARSCSKFTPQEKVREPVELILLVTFQMDQEAHKAIKIPSCRTNINLRLTMVRRTTLTVDRMQM